jgi:epoxyqueuosine reductase
VARYAGGDDYHELMGDRLRAIESGIEALLEAPLRSRSYVDTGPVLERVFAAHAGLGWLGKNGLLIHPRLGSYLLLGVMLSDLELAPDAPEPDRCGTCRACLDACPTGAFTEPRVLDARLCIAYTTIEDPGPIPEQLRRAHGDRLFGCDACQQACPANRGTPATAAEDYRPAPGMNPVELARLLTLDEEGFRQRFPRSPLRRCGREGLLRNASVVLHNQQETP